MVNTTSEEKLPAAAVTKYQAAAEIVNRNQYHLIFKGVIKTVIEGSIEGAKIVDLCQMGDQLIQSGCNAIYNKGKNKISQKGIAFPTCVSVNDIICHYSPLKEGEELVLKNGDVVRIELAAHIDGFIAQTAQTIVVGSSVVTGRLADAIQAAYFAAEAAIRTLRPGNTNWNVTDIIQKVAKEFECIPLEGMLSHQIHQHVFDGEKQIILNPSEQQRKEIAAVTFEEGEAYTLSVLVSTGEGKPKDHTARTTVFKRNEDVTYQLKLKSSRATLSEITQQFGNKAFTLRALEDPKKSMMGISECTSHGLLIPYPVLCEKKNAMVGQFMFTVLLMPSGPLILTPFHLSDNVKSEKSIQNEELKALLAQNVKTKKK